MPPDPLDTHLAWQAVERCSHVPAPDDEGWRQAACVTCISETIAVERRSRAKRG